MNNKTILNDSRSAPVLNFFFNLNLRNMEFVVLFYKEWINYQNTKLTPGYFTSHRNALL